VITLDISMPGQNGWETLHAIKSDPATTEIPVVIVSVVEQKTLAMKLGAADCLVKPVSRNALLAVVRREAGHNRAQSRVLIVDDDVAESELSAEVVRSVGARAEFASSGMEALRLIQQTRPDAVLLDLMMPEMDGFEVLRTIREDPTLFDLPVYIITSKDLNELEMQFLSARTQAIFRKTGSWKEDLQARMLTALRSNTPAKEAS
jgi:CheY-like chemotaxis protein